MVHGCAINKCLLYQVCWLSSSKFSEPSYLCFLPLDLHYLNQSKAYLPCVSDIARLRYCNIFAV